jgi:hypothetical protein
MTRFLQYILIIYWYAGGDRPLSKRPRSKEKRPDPEKNK